MIGPGWQREWNRRRRSRAARAQREQRAAADRLRHRRLAWIGALVLGVVAAIAAVVALGSRAGTGQARAPHDPAAVGAVTRLLSGIPQSGTTLGNPAAAVTITEYADLVCPVCAVHATTTEAALIARYVRGGQVKLVLRGLETASHSHNHAEYVNTMGDVRSAGLQHRAWDYAELAFYEQPQTIGGQAAELTPYITSGYLQGLGAQVPGLDTSAWQAHATDAALRAAVATDAHSAAGLGINGTPTLLVSGPRGTIQYDRNGTESVVPTLARLGELISQVR